MSPGTLYYIHARVACGSSLSDFGEWTTVSFTTESTPLPAGTCEWTGAESTAWFNSANWKCGQLPVTTAEVIISGSRLNYPALNVDITIKKLTLNTGASINVAPNVKLTITGQ